MHLRKFYKMYMGLLMILSIQGLSAEEQANIIVDGIELKTVSTESGMQPAIFTTENRTLPDDSLLEWPCIFNGESNSTTITASFNDVELGFINADMLFDDSFDTCLINIEDVKGESGALTIRLESNSTAVPASLFLIQNARLPGGEVVILNYLLMD